MRNKVVKVQIMPLFVSMNLNHQVFIDTKFL